MNDKPLLLGYHSEKVKELWAQVKDRQFFLKRFNLSETTVKRICSGRQKYVNSTYEYTLKALKRTIKAENPIKELSRPNYQFLKP